MIEYINKNVKSYVVSFILSTMVDTNIICNTALAPGTLLSVGEKR